ncbi:hypothetical protein SO802_033285 [Lithocarpus litseifolius]|uniref:Ribosomal protein L32 n=1 Tax=Lithocarpus litseifolius TaxID=425828 RepID=A0AAW2BI43_9ROSI
MAGSQRKYKRSKSRVQVGQLKKNPHSFKLAFNVPPKLRSFVGQDPSNWNDKASVIQNYKSFGVISYSSFLGV